MSAVKLCWRLRIRYNISVHMEGILYCCQYFLIHGKAIGSVTPIPNVAYHRYRDFTSVGRHKPQLALVSRSRHNFHPSSFIQFTPLVERRCEGENAKPENIIYLLCNLMNLHQVGKLFMSCTAKFFHAFLSFLAFVPKSNSATKRYQHFSSLYRHTYFMKQAKSFSDAGLLLLKTDHKKMRREGKFKDFLARLAQCLICISSFEEIILKQ